MHCFIVWQWGTLQLIQFLLQCSPLPNINIFVELVEAVITGSKMCLDCFTLICSAYAPLLHILIINWLPLKSETNTDSEDVDDDNIAGPKTPSWPEPGTVALSWQIYFEIYFQIYLPTSLLDNVMNNKYYEDENDDNRPKSQSWPQSGRSSSLVLASVLLCLHMDRLHTDFL